MTQTLCRGINVGIDTIHVQTGVVRMKIFNLKKYPTYSFKDLNVAIAELEK